QATTNTLPHKPAPDLGAGQDSAPLVPTNAGPAVAGPEAAVSHTAINAPAVDIYAASEATLTTPGQNDAVSAPGHSGHAVPDLAADLAADLADAHEQQPQAESVHPQ